MITTKLIAALGAAGLALTLSGPALAADETAEPIAPAEQNMSAGEAATNMKDDAVKLGEKAADAAGETAEVVGKGAKQGYEWTKDKATKAWGWSKKKVDDATK